MEEPAEPTPDQTGETARVRCPNCDSVIPDQAEQCLMCGAELADLAGSRPADPQQPGQKEPEPGSEKEESAHAADSRPVVVAQMRERQSRLTFWFTVIAAVFIVALGALVIRFQNPALELALVPSSTPLPPTMTLTPTRRVEATATPPAFLSPTQAPPPSPTVTIRPPQSHVVNPGETLIGLALRYRVSVESISSLNGFDVEAPLQLEQTLEIPWPTATPPLVAVVVTVRGVNIVADPSSCDWYEVQAGDSISSIAAKNDVDFQLLMLLNRMSEETILFQGDALCIPEITIGGFLPATPGPTPTPTAVPPPAGPTLLYPIRDAVITGEDQIVTLQWVAVKDLDQTEWYMVEVADLDEIDSLPRRAFTRDNSFQIPASWRPEGPETHLIRWRVGVVTVTGKRSDGQNIYGYGGEFSEESLFYWSGSSEATVPPISAPSDTSP